MDILRFSKIFLYFHETFYELQYTIVIKKLNLCIFFSNVLFMQKQYTIYLFAKIIIYQHL